MRKIPMTVAAVGVMFGALATVAPEQTAHARQTSHNTITYTQTTGPTVQPLDCVGSSGRMGLRPRVVLAGRLARLGLLPLLILNRAGQ